jgi:hypothetical protein
MRHVGSAVGMRIRLAKASRSGNWPWGQLSRGMSKSNPPVASGGNLPGEMIGYLVAIFGGYSGAQDTQAVCSQPQNLMARGT